MEYIPLGCDCSVAFQLHSYGLRKNAYPFDWIRTNNLDDIINILQNNFQFFLDVDKYSVSDKFPCMYDDDWNDDESKNYILKNNKYSIIYPHEIKYDDIYDVHLESFKKKYQRRIERFSSVIGDEHIKKIFIRISNKDENYDLLKKVLDEICVNYELRIIKIDKKTKFSSWKKDELDWKTYFIE